jgi:hypothetical protein
MGRGEQAVEHFERALVANAELGAPGSLARTQVDYARAIGSFGGPGDPRAGELLDAAAEAAERHGLGAVARKVAALRAESGSPV